MPKPHVYNATLVERVDVTQKLGVFRIQPDAPPAHRPWFVAGQYTLLGLNREPEIDPEPDDAPVSVQRPISLASEPRAPVAEFYLRLVEHPTSPLPLTKLLWRRGPGARVYMRPTAAGKFTLHDTIGIDDPRLKLLVAGGTGVGPLIAFVRSRVGDGDNLEDIVVLHGVSRPADLAYRDELEGLERTHGLRYLPTISRPDADPRWEGETGRVEALLAADRIEHTEALLGLRTGLLIPQHAAVFVCGLRGTIAETITALLRRGFVPHHPRIRRALAIDEDVSTSIFHEQFDSEPILDLKDPGVVAHLRAQLIA